MSLDGVGLLLHVVGLIGLVVSLAANARITWLDRQGATSATTRSDRPAWIGRLQVASLVVLLVGLALRLAF